MTTLSITLLKKVMSPTMGARSLKRLFESELKKPLSKKILFEDLRNVQILVQRKEEELNFEDIKEI